MPPKTRLVYAAKEKGREVFSCPLQCMRCIGRRADGRQCARRSCIGAPFCWTHARKLAGVQVRDVPGMGKGVVAARAFRKGEFILPYMGEVLSKAEYERRYVTGNQDSVAEYVIVDGADRHVDAACTRFLGGIVNTSLGKKPRAAPELGPVDGQPVQYLSSILRGTNAKFTVRTKGHDWHGMQVPAKSAWIVATKPIKEGDQVVCYYGDDYRVYITPGFQTSGTSRRKA